MAMEHKILLCEDDAGVRESVSMLLKIVGYDVEAIDRAEKVKAMLEAFDPDLLLIDLWLPKISGDACIRSIRKNETDRLPIILFSANTDVKRIARECDADDYLIKPFEIEELEHKVKVLLTN
jgi:DNA-binding response OmpR family regulator